VATVSETTAGVTIVTRPAPARNAPRPDRIAAPLFPSEPATSKTCPKVPLWDLTERTSGNRANSSGPAQRSVPCPISSTSAAGEPIAQTSNAPTASASRDRSWPTLGAVKVTVRCAQRTGPSARCPSEGSPEGVSTARINSGRAAVARAERRLMDSMACAISPVAAPRRPVPRSASTMASESATKGQALCQAASSSMERMEFPPSR
jgi:hypothetical protein